MASGRGKADASLVYFSGRLRRRPTRLATSADPKLSKPFAVFAMAENLIALAANPASRVGNPMAQSRIRLVQISGTDKEFCMSRQTHLAALEQRHEALAKEIEEELVHPARDELKLSELKRRKLQLKDEITRLQSEQTPFEAH